MRADFNSLVAEVKSAANIVDVCERNGVQTTQTGYRYKALCPFHQENTPSFVIDDRSQSFHCFGCGAKGDVLSFVQKYTNTDFMDALRIVGESYQVDVDSKIAEIYGSDNNQTAVDYKVLRACVQQAADYYELRFYSLEESHPAKRTITDRKLSLNEDKLHVYLGYADTNPNNLVKYLTSNGFDIETIIEAGLARKVDTKNGEKVFDVFTNRLLFAFTDQVGRVVGFSGRKLDDEDFGGKYVNTGDTPLFHKGSLIYNFFNARKAIGNKRKVYVVEGQCDVVAMQQAGLENVVAISGTATTEEHMKLLNRSVGANGKIIFCLDGDTAGLKAMKKTVENYKIAQNKGFAIVFQPNVDPCSLYTENGAQGLVDYVNNKEKTAPGFISYLCTRGIDSETTSGKQKAINRLVSMCAQVDNDTFVHLCANDLSKQITMSTDTIVKSVKDGAKTRTGDTTFNNVRTGSIDTNKNNEHNAFILHSVRMGFDTVNVEKVKQSYNKVVSHDFGSIEIRLFSLVVRYPGLVKEFGEPVFRVKVIREMYEISQKLPHNRKMVAEEYGKNNVFASMLFFDDSLFPALHLIGVKEVGEHYDYLLNRLQFLGERKNKADRHAQIIDFLMKNNDLSIEHLKDKMIEYKLDIK